MRIGVNTLFLIPGEVGGSETYLRQTLYHMAEGYPDTGLVLFTNRENDPVLRKDLSLFGQVEFQRLKFRASNRFIRILREQTELPIKVKRSGVDVLWSPGYTAPFFSSCPQVTSILDMQYKSHPDDMTPVARMVTDILVQTAVRRSQRILTISNFSKQEILRHTSASEERVGVSYLAAGNEFTRIAFSEGKKFQLSDSTQKIPAKPYILSVANTYPHKGIHTLIEAFGRILNDVDCDLVLVGLPRLGERKVEKAIARLDDSQCRVKRFSKQPIANLVALYSQAELFVFPSLYEGFGLPVLEAMMAGTPVVTTQKGSIPEIAGNHAVYADPPDASTIAQRMVEVLGWSQQRRGECIKEAKRHASEFTWKNSVAETLNALRLGRDHEKKDCTLRRMEKY